MEGAETFGLMLEPDRKEMRESVLERGTDVGGEFVAALGAAARACDR